MTLRSRPFASGLLGLFLAQVGASSEPTEDAWIPLAKGNKWTYKTDYAEDTDLVYEIAAVEKVGTVECFVVEHKTVSPQIGTRMLRKEWLAPGPDGIRIHRLQRGRSEMDVDPPFFKLKQDLRKDVEWSGEAKAADAPPKYQVRVVGEESVEVPAGKFETWKILVKVEAGLRHQAEGHEWYARNVGMIKSEMTLRTQGETFTLVSELKSFQPGK